MTEEPPAEAHGGPYRLECIGSQFLRDQPDFRSRCAVFTDDVVAVYDHGAFRRGDDTANDADQSGFACAIGPQQGENFTLADLEVDTLQRLVTGSVGLGQVQDGYNCRHQLILTQS